MKRIIKAFTISQMLLIITVAVLVFILLVKLRVSPNTVLQRVQVLENRLNLQSQEIHKRLDAIDFAINESRDWRHSMTAAIHDATEHQWTRDDEIEHWKQVLEQNPSIRLELESSYLFSNQDGFFEATDPLELKQ